MTVFFVGTRFTIGRCKQSGVHLSIAPKSVEKLSVSLHDLNSSQHYDFDLPKELIAQEPLENREDARLLVVDRRDQSITHSHVRDLDCHLQPGDCLVLNDTRVVPAQLVGKRKQTGGRWQGLVVESDGQHWKMMAKTRGKIQPGELVDLHDREGKPTCELQLLSKTNENFWIGRPVVSTESPLVDSTLAEILQAVGRVPLPHYIRGGNMVDADTENYQTVFAKHVGAVAAPTAGLHFTESLLRRLIDRGVKIAPVTLHVGMGTFRPLSSDSLDEHQMHSEKYSFSETTAKAIQQCRKDEGRIVAVGTTSVRVLESLQGDTIGPEEGATDLFIKPGHEFQNVDCLMTNFHVPKSTLIVLVRTFGGDKLLQQAYKEAVAEKYRFFSYGDAMLIL